jgi:hypothetical protein
MSCHGLLLSGTSGLPEGGISGLGRCDDRKKCGVNELAKPPRATLLFSGPYDWPKKPHQFT